jgi:hypothetical protein
LVACKKNDKKKLNPPFSTFKNADPPYTVLPESFLSRQIALHAFILI